MAADVLLVDAGSYWGLITLQRVIFQCSCMISATVDDNYYQGLTGKCIDEIEIR